MEQKKTVCTADGPAAPNLKVYDLLDSHQFFEDIVNTLRSISK